MSDAGESRSNVRTALPYLLGVLALLLMLIPQLALYYVYHLIVRAVLSGLIVYLASCRTTRQAVVFTLLMGALSWLFDLEEGAVVAFFTAAGILVALTVGKGPGPVYARVALGCLIGAVVLVGGMAGLMLWRKESGLWKALQFGLRNEWQTLVAGMLGGMVGAYIASRK